MCIRDRYYIVTDRWQNFTDEAVTTELLDKLSSYCCEFLVHAVDVEGRVNGIEKELVAMLGSWGRIPVTYAGGVSSFDDLKCIRQLGQNHLNVTIGLSLIHILRQRTAMEISRKRLYPSHLQILRSRREPKLLERLDS